MSNAGQFNPVDLLGSLMNKGMSQSSASRIEHSLGDKGVGGQGGILGQILGGLSGPGQSAGGSGGPLGSLGKIAGALMGGEQGGKTLAAGGLGALAGAILGGGTKSMGGAMGGGALALLGSLAMQAFRKSGKSPQTDVDSTTQLMAGLRAPETELEQQQVQDVALLTLKAMINAAKADGQIDDRELQRIVGELKEDGVTSEEQQFVMEEMRKPLDLEGIARAATNPQVAAQLYAASLLAIEVDTDAERRYLQQLAASMGLDDEVVRHLRGAVGLN